MPALELASAVFRRRERLGARQTDVERDGGPSVATLNVVEQGRRDAPAKATLRRLDSGLRWESGTAARVLSGQMSADEAVDAPRAVELGATMSGASSAARDGDGMPDALSLLSSAAAVLRGMDSTPRVRAALKAVNDAVLELANELGDPGGA